MYKPTLVDDYHEQLGSELLAKFLQSRFWDGWNGTSTSNIWDSQEMMEIINETLLNSYHDSTDTFTLPGGSANSLYNTTTRAPLSFYGESFKEFRKRYIDIHGYLAIVISAFGVISNIINIAVLTRRSMITPTNTILTALAIVDALVMMTYIPFAIHQYILKESTDESHNMKGYIPIAQWRSYSWFAFILFNIHFTIVCHTVSVWLTITLAVFRYIAVTFPAKVQEYCSMRRAIMAVVASWACTTILCTPSYLSVQVGIVTEDHLIAQMLNQGDNVTMYRIEESPLSLNNMHIPRKISFYAFSVLAKLVPCFILTFLSIQLVQRLLEAERRRYHLKNPNGPPRQATTASNHSANGGTSGTIATETTRFLSPPRSSVAKSGGGATPGRDRTTRMLLAILIFFLITEFPSGLVALFSCFSEDFFNNVYTPLGDLMDILALINSSVNFILYCSMSRQFRKTFCHMFVPISVTQRWKLWKVRHGGALSTNTTALTERTFTYLPANRTNDKDRRKSCATFYDDDLGVS